MLFARFAFEIAAEPERLVFVSPVIVFEPAAIVLLVKASEVFLPTSVSVAAGNVRVPLAVDDAINLVNPEVPLKSIPEVLTVLIPILFKLVIVALVYVTEEPESVVTIPAL